jgi:uncharacterized integral membrane protein
MSLPDSLRAHHVDADAIHNADSDRVDSDRAGSELANEGPRPAWPGAEESPHPADRRIPRTRTAVAWTGICVAAAASLVLVVFMAQNTRRTEVTFLWMHGSIPLALALLIAAVSAALLTMVVGVARITQLRRLAARQR